MFAVFSGSCTIHSEGNVQGFPSGSKLGCVYEEQPSMEKTTSSLKLDVMSAGYASFLTAFAAVCKPPYAWTLPTRYLYVWTPHAVSIGRVNFVLTYAVLFLIPAAVVLVSLRVAEHFRMTFTGVRILTGFIALAGFPLVCLYALPRTFALSELGISVVALILWAQERWPVSDGLNIVLLVSHHSFWLLFCVSLLGRATRPIALWSEWDYLVFVYPTFGLFYSLLWARDFERRG